MSGVIKTRVWKSKNTITWKKELEVSDRDLEEEEPSPFFPFPFQDDELWLNICTLKKD
jgi:hypothetical protein